MLLPTVAPTLCFEVRGPQLKRFVWKTRQCHFCRKKGDGSTTTDTCSLNTTGSTLVMSSLLPVGTSRIRSTVLVRHAVMNVTPVHVACTLAHV